MQSRVVGACNNDSELADYTELLEATARLLTAPEWRQRVVEKLRPQSADHYELRRSFQFEIPQSLMEDIAVKDKVPVLLPVCWLPKEALLDFDVTDGTGSSLIVLERRSIAGALAQILDAWRMQVPELTNLDLSQSRVESICVASLSPWRQAQDRAKRKPDHEALRSYLADTTEYLLTPRDAQTALDRGRSLAQRAYELLGRTWTPRELDNTATGAAILIPYLEKPPASHDALIASVEAHHDQIEQLIEIASESDDALSWLWILVEAGVRWPVLIRYIATVDEPFLVKIRELRGSGDDNARVFRHEADIGAARSFHLHVEAPDPSLRIVNEPTALTDTGEEVGAPETFESMKWTQELFAVYTSRAERPDRVSFQITFGLEATAWLPYALALLFVAMALVATALLNVDGATATVLTIPPALVSGFLVTRDTALVARFLFVPRLTLVLLNVGLWGFVLGKLVW